jgi:hypothetical protein
MRHFWFYNIDRRALPAVQKALNDAGARVFAASVDPQVAGAMPEGVTVMPVSLSVEDETGCNIRGRSEELTAIYSRRLAEALAAEPLPRAQRPWTAEWTRLYGAYLYVDVKPIAEFIAFCENLYRVGDLEIPDQLVFDLGFVAVAELLAREIGPALRVKASVSVNFERRSMLPTILVMLARLAAQAAWLGLRRYLRPSPSRKFEVGRPTVLVEYDAFTSTYFPLGANQDWFEFSGLPPGQLVFYFQRSDSQLSREAVEWMDKNGFGWIDAIHSTWCDRRPVATALKCLGSLLSLLPTLSSREGRYRWLVLALALPLVERQRDLLRQTGAAALFQHSEFLPSAMALAIASRQEEVALVWSFSSVLIFLTATNHHAFADLLLAWGPLDLVYANAQSFEYRYAVQCGALGYDGAEKGDVEEAAALRARLGAKPRFVVAIFDSSHMERSIHQSTERCALFYRTVLALVRNNRDWGCLIKSKGLAYDVLPRQDGLQDVVAELEAEGRCLRLPPAVKPSLVAQASDVIASFSINSAGFLAGLGSGRPSLHFDPNRLLLHPLVLDGAVGCIFFHEAEDFVHALREVAAGNSTYGDMSKWSKLLDPFQDGLGRERSGKVIGDYIAARDRGETLQDALCSAADAFARRYGRGLVSSRRNPPENLAGMLWRETRKHRYPDWPDDYPYSPVLRTSDVPSAKCRSTG